MKNKTNIIKNNNTIRTKYVKIKEENYPYDIKEVLCYNERDIILNLVEGVDIKYKGLLNGLNLNNDNYFDRLVLKTKISKLESINESDIVGNVGIMLNDYYQYNCGSIYTDEVKYNQFKNTPGYDVYYDDGIHYTYTVDDVSSYLLCFLYRDNVYKYLSISYKYDRIVFCDEYKRRGSKLKNLNTTKLKYFKSYKDMIAYEFYKRKNIYDIKFFNHQQEEEFNEVIKYIGQIK